MCTFDSNTIGEERGGIVLDNRTPKPDVFVRYVPCSVIEQDTLSSSYPGGLNWLQTKHLSDDQLAIATMSGNIQHPYSLTRVSVDILNDGPRLKALLQKGATSLHLKYLLYENTSDSM